MFSGGGDEEVARWLRNFVTSHAKRENLRAEAVIDSEGPREGRSYGVRLRLGEALSPPADEAPLDLAYEEVARNRGHLAWCAALADRVRALARATAQTPAASPRSR
jgi:hypothetical protein